MPNPKNPSDRVKASKLRGKLARGKIDDVDRLWLDEYDQSTARAEKERQQSAQSAARSRSKEQRRVRIEVDEAAEHQAEAVGPAAAALAAREEGRRIDALALGSTAALREACDVYKDICLTLKENFEILSDAVVQSMTSQRAHYLAAGELQLALQQAEQNSSSGDPAQEMLVMMLAKHFGLTPEEAAPVRAAAAAAAQRAGKRRPPQNGAATK